MARYRFAIGQRRRKSRKRRRRQIILTIVLFALVGGIALLASRDKSSSPIDTNVELPPLDLDTQKRIGDVEASIVQAGVDWLIQNRDGESIDRGTRLVVKLRLKNESSSRIVTFAGWQGTALVADAQGNEYRGVKFPKGFKIWDGPEWYDKECNCKYIVAKDLLLYPGQCYLTWLFFEPVPTTCKEVTITVPAAALDGQGTVTFTVPVRHLPGVN